MPNLVAPIQYINWSPAANGSQYFSPKGVLAMRSATFRPLRSLQTIEKSQLLIPGPCFTLQTHGVVAGSGYEAQHHYRQQSVCGLGLPARPVADFLEEKNSYPFTAFGSANLFMQIHINQRSNLPIKRVSEQPRSQFIENNDCWLTCFGVLVASGSLSP